MLEMEEMRTNLIYLHLVKRGEDAWLLSGKNKSRVELSRERT
jgi:hypothetical protein